MHNNTPSVTAVSSEIFADVYGYQSLDGKEYVAGAIVESLRFHGIESSINSWVD